MQEAISHSVTHREELGTPSLGQMRLPMLLQDLNQDLRKLHEPLAIDPTDRIPGHQQSVLDIWSVRGLQLSPKDTQPFWLMLEQPYRVVVSISCGSSISSGRTPFCDADASPYPKGCCRHEYALPVYEPGSHKKITTLYIDQIYFSTSEAAGQTPNTSLVLVETKRPGETSLDRALDQARTYSSYLSPLFLVATDARWLHVVKRHCYRDEETIFNDQIEALRDQTKAYQLYHDLHFSAVQRLKQSLAEAVPHTLFIDIMHALGDHPNLQTELATRDFRPEHIRDGRCLVVKEPKVSLKCTLPLAFGDGECCIQFSNLLLRGLVCRLTHRQILTELLPGLDCEPQYGTRHFVRRTENGNYEAHLGNTTVLLSEREAADLCHCVDVVGTAYKAVMVSAENTLETWNYTPVNLPGFGMHGFRLCSVPTWLWKCVKQFAYEHDRFTGNSVWHTFDRGNTNLKIIHPYMKTAALIIPLYNFEADDIDLIYCFETDDTLEFRERDDKYSWQQTIGPHGH
jgi:hypothetical protein